MTYIQVDPPLLNNSSDEIRNLGTETRSAGNALLSTADRAPSYDGQFGPKVQRIAAQANSKAGSLSGILANLSGILHKKANDFAAADAESVAGFHSAQLSDTSPWGFFDFLPAWMRISDNTMFSSLRWSLASSLIGVFPPMSIGLVTIPFSGMLWNGGVFSGVRKPGWWPFGQKDTESSQIKDAAEQEQSQPSRDIGGKALLQNKPESDKRIGDKRILDITVTWNDNKQISHTTPIKEHIKKYGCLMTGYTMLLQDKGVDVDVTDLYKAKYELTPGNNFNNDANDGTIILSDLNTIPQVINKAAPNYEAGGTSEMVSKAEELQQRLRNSIDEYQSVILRVKNPDNPIDGHWIVVDGYNVNDGTFNIRNPWETGKEEGITIGENGKSRFFSNNKIEYKYIHQKI